MITFYLYLRKQNFCMFCKITVTHGVITRETTVQSDIFHTYKEKGNYLYLTESSTF